MRPKLHVSPETLRAYQESEAQLTQRHLIVGCLLVMVLMPAGAILDFAVYPDQAGAFFRLRLLCVALAAGLLVVLQFQAGRRWQRVIGVLVAMLPVTFITWMIALVPAENGGPSGSPYYAGLNLSLLAIAFVMRWSVDLSVFTSALTLLIYVATCMLLNPLPVAQRGIFINNIYFLSLTAVIVIVGTWLHGTLRLREFALTHELDLSRRTLEENNVTLDSQNKELADTIQKLTEAESQLVQSEKMASLGRMSAGIIHEINNPLNFATTNLFTLRKKAKYISPDQQADYEDILKDVEEGIVRVKNIVSDLRMFTHPSTDDQDQVVASEVVTSALRFLSNELKDQVAIEQKLPEGQTVHANKNKLIHVFVNLLQNSMDALGSKPFTNGERPTIWIEGRVENGSSCLVVRDNGPGIASEHLDKIFDPFFTTKEVGAGMGLGLSICYRILHESQGRIAVRTEEGKFCEFTLEFPVEA